MNDKKKWNRRLAPHIYDYNYKVGESYYTPQTDYIENRELLRSREKPPEAQTFAERYSSRPFYGNTRGLPYDSSTSALSKPLMTRRAQSTGRARSRDPEIDDTPSASRLGRERDRKVAFNMDDYKSKLIVDDAFNFQVAPKRYARSSQKIASEEDFDINPRLKKELEDEFKRIKNEFRKANSIERGSVPRTSQYEESVYNSDLGLPSKRRVKHEEVNYSLPPTGTKVRKSSYTESSKFESTRPPRAPKPSRLSSIEDDMNFKMPKSFRSRKFSMSEIDDDDFALKYHVPRPNSRYRTAEEEKSFQQDLSLREQRRVQESEQLSSNISNLIKKMKDHDLEDGYKFTRSIRASSLDPYERETRTNARSQARVHQFSYGVSK